MISMEAPAVADVGCASLPGRLSILWRGPLDSCNYSCGYCPFAKRPVRADNLAEDRAALERFVDWVESAEHPLLDLLFTPWGEALVHRHYREALVRLSRCPRVGRVAIQTNGSALGSWVAEADPGRLGFWTTFHPGEADPGVFAGRIHAVVRQGFRVSVGGVASTATIAALEDLHQRLPAGVVRWLNPRRPGPPLTGDLLDRCRRIDPWFDHGLVVHASRGRTCATGADVVSIDGSGDVRRCHFVDEILGNIYEAGWQRILRRRTCPRAGCDCYIGYVHLDHLDLRRVYGAGVLERIPDPAFEPLPPALLA